MANGSGQIQTKGAPQTAFEQHLQTFLLHIRYGSASKEDAAKALGLVCRGIPEQRNLRSTDSAI